MTKILFVTPGCFDKGGISRYSRYQIRALRELYGFDSVRVLSMLPPSEEGFEDPISVTWHGPGTGLRSKVQLASQVLRQALSWKPDVIHSAHINFSAMCVGIARIANASTLLNTYGLEVWSAPSRDAIWGLKKSRHVIADCHSTADYLEGEKLRPKGSVPVIWDCVDLKQFHPGVELNDVIQKYGIPDPTKHRNILTLGRLAHEAMHKGYDRLMKVFVTVHRKCPNSKLVIAGRGNAAHKLAALAKELGISDSVTFTGSVDESDLASVYRTATVFSLVSDRGNGRGEGIPLTPLEAMACGIPIVVGTHDGSKEAIDGSSNGFAIDPFNLNEHASKLLTLLTDPVLREQQSQACWRVAKKNFSFDHFKTDHDNLFQDILTPENNNE